MAFYFAPVPSKAVILPVTPKVARTMAHRDIMATGGGLSLKSDGQ